MQQNYDRRANHERSRFDSHLQRAIIERAQEACEHLSCRLHGAASEVGHLHFLLSWKTPRTWESIRTSLKSSLTRYLHENHPDVDFSRGGSRKRVNHRAHLNYLTTRYLSDHPGWGWYEDRGWVKPRI